MTASPARLQKSDVSPKSFISCILLIGILLLGARARAASDRCQSDRTCQTQTEQAEQYVSQSRYKEALVLYQSAYGHSQEPRLLINIGRCFYRVGRAQEALESYAAFQKLESAPGPELAGLLAQFSVEARQAVADDSRADAEKVPTPAAASDTCQEDGACRAMTQQAERRVEQSRYEEALLLYQNAYTRSREPRLLVNIGRCFYRMGRPVKALSFYELFQKSPPHPDPELNTDLSHFIDEAKQAMSATALHKADAVAEPPPAPLAVEAVKPLPTELRRPRWRLAAGGAALGLGLVFLGLGAYALAADGDCVNPSATAMGLCSVMTAADGTRTTQLLDGKPAGAGFMVTAVVFFAAGAVLVALPGRRTPVAWSPLRGSGWSAAAH